MEAWQVRASHRAESCNRNAQYHARMASLYKRLLLGFLGLTSIFLGLLVLGG